MKSTVYLIGAGPGDPELLTLRGASCLGRADVVLYDGLSNTRILNLAPRAEHICVGKHGQTRIWKQPEIIAEMLRHARDGKVVARLKGGDPAVFARTAEEVDALREAEIPFEIVPGITAALAAGSYAGIPVTHRKFASAVALVTGHEEPGKPESALDWHALARFPGTLVVYMGVTTAKAWTTALIEAGKDPATPAALVRRCTLPDQATILCRLDEVVDQLTPAKKFRPPVIAIIGEVCSLAESMAWISKRPLAGQSIVITRPQDQAESMAEIVRDLGGYPIIAPAIAVAAVDDRRELDRAIDRLAETDTLVFCSTNGVDHFFDALSVRQLDARALAGVDIAVVGRKTSDRLRDHGIQADTIPTDFRASSLFESLKASVSGRRITLLRASRGSAELSLSLRSAGAKVHEVVTYKNIDVDVAEAAVLDGLDKGTIDWITATSTATAKNLFRLYGQRLQRARIAALSPVTAAAFAEVGIQADVVADPYTIESMLHAIAEKTQS